MRKGERMGGEPELGDRCPACSQGKLLLIVYNDNGESTSQAAKKGLVLLGGNRTSDDAPSLGCNRCGAKFGGRKEMLQFMKLKKLMGFKG